MASAAERRAVLTPSFTGHFRQSASLTLRQRYYGRRVSWVRNASQVDTSFLVVLAEPKRRHTQAKRNAKRDGQSDRDARAAVGVHSDAQTNEASESNHRPEATALVQAAQIGGHPEI